MIQVQLESQNSQVPQVARFQWQGRISKRLPAAREVSDSTQKPKNDPVYNFKASCTSLAEQISENRIIEAKSIEDLTNSLGMFPFRILQACSLHKRPVLISRPYFYGRGRRPNL